MRKKASFLAAMALTLTMAMPALAHDGWSQTNTPIIAPGEVSYVELLFGNHSNHHASYRIEGRWSTDSTKVYVTSPNGTKTDISSTLFYTGEEKEVTEPGKNNYFVASFSSSSLGAYIVSVEGDSIFKHGEVASRTLRSAKSFVAVSDIPTVERVKLLKGFSKPVSPDRAELIPLFNPVAVTPGHEVAVQLQLKGKPLANAEITVIRRSTSDSQIIKTDANGKATFKTGPADYYLLRAKPTTDEKVTGQYDSTNYEATMTFTVQNGKHVFPQAARQSLPIVYVNGQPVDVKGLKIVNGKAMVPASFIQSALSAAYKGTGSVELRKTAEQLGASVEYLSPVGVLPPSVIIQTAKR
jgi:uncharacterized GH25 family protein